MTLILVLLVALAGACTGSRPLPRLEPIPELDESQVQGAMADQYHDRRSAVEAALEAGDPEDLARAFGRLGELLHAYRLVDLALPCYRNAARLSPDDSRWWHDLGLAHQRRGDHPGAVEAFDRVLGVNPDDPFARIHRAEALLALGRADEAEADAAPVREHQVVGAAARYLLGRIALSQGRPAEAIEELERVLELQPSAARVHYTLALAYRDAGDPDAARRQLALQGPQEVELDDPRVRRLEALATTAGAYARRGALALMAERTEDAVTAYERAVEADPTDVEARRNLGLALMRSGRASEARATLEAARGIAPENVWVAFDLGNALVATGSIEESIAVFREALDLAPELDEARFNLANALMQTGRWRPALEELERLLEQRPDHVRARYQAAMARARLGETGAAVTALESMTRDRPESPLPWIGLGSLAEARSDPEEARRCFGAALDRGTDEEDVPALLGLARLARAAGRPSEALEHYGEVLAASPGNPEARRGEAEVLLQSGRWSEARARLERPGTAADPVLAHLLARLLAGAPDPSLRDGPRALALAQQLMAAQPSLAHGETLAVALGAVGRFAEAADLERRLLDEARTAGLPSPTLEAMEDRLAALASGQPILLAETSADG